MKKITKNREKIVEELKELKKKGFSINVAGSQIFTVNSAGPCVITVQTGSNDVLQELRSSMNLTINRTDTESDIFDKIGEAKEILNKYEEIVKHRRSSPDLIEYIKFNLED